MHDMQAQQPNAMADICTFQRSKRQVKRPQYNQTCFIVYPWFQFVAITRFISEHPTPKGSQFVSLVLYSSYAPVKLCC